MQLHFGFNRAKVKSCLQIEFVQIKIIVGNLLVVRIRVLTFKTQPLQQLVNHEEERSRAPPDGANDENSACYGPEFVENVQHMHHGCESLFGQDLRAPVGR
ncbi:hypothetical protein D3C86_1453160 [compost metagenome]